MNHFRYSAYCMCDFGPYQFPNLFIIELYHFTYLDDILSCTKYECLQHPDDIVCSLVFPPPWISGKTVQFRDITLIMLDCNVLRLREIQCSLEVEGCRNFDNKTVSADAISVSFSDTCHAHTYCIIARVTMETSRPVYLNTTASKFHDKA